MRQRIVDGVIEVLANVGVCGLTHRAVARAAGVSLAATTRHYKTKSDILADASNNLLAGYIDAFKRLEDRVRTGQEPRLRTLDDLVMRVVLNSIGRERRRSLAWCELILHGGRSPEGRLLARGWFSELDAIWLSIAQVLEPGLGPRQVSVAIDQVVGLTVLLHPLGLDPATARSLIEGRIRFDALLSHQRKEPVLLPTDGVPVDRRGGSREKIIQAAIEILIGEGAAAVSYRAVAERAGLVRSGPSYYFPTITGLLAIAQQALFERAKARYRIGLSGHPATEMDGSRLIDLSTAIYFREILEFAMENLGFYSVWMSAAQNPSLSPTISAALLDQYKAWQRRLGSVSSGEPDIALPLRMQAGFVGKLVRAIATGTDMTELSKTREDFTLTMRTYSRWHPAEI